MPVIQQEDRILLRHPKGASAEVLLFGATVVSWKSTSPHQSEPIERLFVSSKAALDGSKAVRGGIPIVFPCFSLPSHPDHRKLKQHGFARTEHWKWDGIVMDNDAGVSVRLVLEPTLKTQDVYDKPFRLQYVVTLAEHQLSTDIHVHNPSSSEVLEYQALFHNYIRAPAYDVMVAPLQGKYYYDKTEASEEARAISKLETRQQVSLRVFTDSIYENASQHYDVTWPGGGIAVRSHELKDLVIWNPWEVVGGELVDMESQGWEHFVCVEPGHVAGFVKLDAGKTWIGQQVLTVMSDGKTSLL